MLGTQAEAGMITLHAFNKDDNRIKIKFLTCYFYLKLAKKQSINITLEKNLLRQSPQNYTILLLN
jgi:hypothetical protein